MDKTFSVRLCVGDETHLCRWKNGAWIEYVKEGVQWSGGEPLSETGRAEILKKFGLSDCAFIPPTCEIGHKSPKELLGIRRVVEEDLGLLQLNPVSDMDDHLSAELVSA